MTPKHAIYVILACALVGCGGGSVVQDTTGTGTTATTATTSSTSGNGGSSGDVSRFAGTWSGSFSGGNTTGARYSGTGSGEVGDDGAATFDYNATVAGGARVTHEFTGTVDKNGAFEGEIDSGEAATGTVTLNEDSTLHVVLKWKKLQTNGNVFYTSTETFDLAKPQSG